MRLWRITSQQWALDRQCEGARHYGGRWNPPGTSALYAATTVELCALEKFVHLGAVPVTNLVLVAIDLPADSSLITSAPLTSLPLDWDALPAPATTQTFGKQWLSESNSLALLLPSAIVPEAQIALINPYHTAFKDLRMHIVRRFNFDGRLFG